MNQAISPLTSSFEKIEPTAAPRPMTARGSLVQVTERLDRPAVHAAQDVPGRRPPHLHRRRSESRNLLAVLAHRCQVSDHVDPWFPGKLSSGVTSTCPARFTGPPSIFPSGEGETPAPQSTVRAWNPLGTQEHALVINRRHPRPEPHLNLKLLQDLLGAGAEPLGVRRQQPVEPLDEGRSARSGCRCGGCPGEGPGAPSR